MGWSSWNQFLCDGINEDVVLQSAAALVDHNLSALGYRYVNLDDCWQAQTRNATDQSLMADPVKFPSGIPSLARKLHAMGLKLGVYSDVGEKTCQGRPGSFGHFELDAKTFAAWEVDYVKLDTCSLTKAESKDQRPYYTQFRDALNATGRPILYSMCNWGAEQPWAWPGREISNSWRISKDVYPLWNRVVTVLDIATRRNLSSYVKGPGGFNDMDMLEVGVQGRIFNYKWAPHCNLTLRESRSHYTMWALLSSPLILGLDLRQKVDAYDLETLSNEEVIDQVNQDPSGVQGSLLTEVRTGAVVTYQCVTTRCSHTQVWAKRLAGGRVAVALLNRADPWSQTASKYSTEAIEVTWAQLRAHGLTEGQVAVRDLWARAAVNVAPQAPGLQIHVPPHGVSLLIVGPAATATARAAAYELQADSVRDCTFMECERGGCNPGTAPFLCVGEKAGDPQMGCSASAWPKEACSDSCTMVNCAKRHPAPGTPTCKGKVCPSGICKGDQLCGQASPFQCLEGSARFGCSADQYSWAAQDKTLCGACCDSATC